MISMTSIDQVAPRPRTMQRTAPYAWGHRAEAVVADLNRIPTGRITGTAVVVRMTDRMSTVTPQFNADRVAGLAVAQGRPPRENLC